MPIAGHELVVGEAEPGSLQIGSPGHAVRVELREPRPQVGRGSYLGTTTTTSVPRVGGIEVGLVHVTQKRRVRNAASILVADNGGVGCEAVDVLTSEKRRRRRAESPSLGMPHVWRGRVRHEARLNPSSGTFKHAGLVVDRHPTRRHVSRREAVVGRWARAGLAQRQAIRKNGNRTQQAFIAPSTARSPRVRAKTPHGPNE